MRGGRKLGAVVRPVAGAVAVAVGIGGLGGPAAQAEPRSATGAAAAGGTAGTADGSGDAPDPGGPLDRARASVAARQADADRLQADLADADRQTRAAQARAGAAAEAYDAAAARAAQARQTVAAALARLDAARAAQAEADTRLGTLAATMYKQGPDIARLTVLLHIGTLREFTDKEQALRRASAATTATVRRARSATAAAQTAQHQAQTALTEQEAAEHEALAARTAAAQAAAAEQVQLDRIRARREATLTALAAARGVQLDLERRRQEDLAEQQARAAGTGPGALAAGPMPAVTGPARTFLAYVYAQLGKPYVWGGAGPDVFDCSGLAMRGLEAAGYDYPHPAQWQYLAMTPVTYRTLRPGDLVFWATDPADPHTIYHEAVALGGDRVIQAPRPGRNVEVASLWANGTPSFYGRP